MNNLITCCQINHTLYRIRKEFLVEQAERFWIDDAIKVLERKAIRKKYFGLVETHQLLFASLAWKQQLCPKCLFKFQINQAAKEKNDKNSKKIRLDWLIESKEIFLVICWTLRINVNAQSLITRVLSRA